MCAGGDVDWTAESSREMLLRALEALLGNAGSLTDIVVVSVPGCAAGRMQPMRQLRAVAASPPPPLPPGGAAPPASPSSTLQISVQATDVASAQALTALLSDAQASPAGTAALAGAFQAAGLATTSLAVSAVELTENPADASDASPAAAADSGNGRLLGLLALLLLLLLLCCCCCFAVWRRRGRVVVPFAATVALRWPVDSHDPTSLTMAVCRHMRAERPGGDAPVALPRVMRRKLAAAMASALQTTGADVIDVQLQECVASWLEGSAKAPVLRLAARAFFEGEPPPRDAAGEDAEGGSPPQEERSAQFARMLPPARARHSRPPPDGAVTSALRRQSNCGDVRAVWLWRELPALLRGAGGSSVASSAVDEPQAASSPSAHKAASTKRRVELHTLAPPARHGRATAARRAAARPLPPTPIGEEESIMPPPAATAAAAGTSAAVVVAIPEAPTAQPADAAEAPDAAPEEEAQAKPSQPGFAGDGDPSAYACMVRDLFKTY
jgi:hypothetical protein